MSIWKPEWRVLLDGGLDYATTTLSGLTITSGRTNIYNQPQPGYASFTIVDFNETTFPVEVNDSVTIELKDSTGTYIPIFGGFVTDLVQQVSASGSISNTQNLNIIALGALGRLPKALTDGVLSKDFDGNQIYTILSQVLFGKWNQVPSALTWATYDPTEIWTNAINTGLGEIDQPGDYELDARASGITDIYTLVAALATSGLGYLYEDGQGRISYADSTHRTEYLTTNSFKDLSATKASGVGLKSYTKLGDLRNKVTIKYKFNQASEVSVDDQTSIGLYGEQAAIINTTLDKLADATSQANFYLGLRSYPQANFDSINFQLDNPELNSTERDLLIKIFMGLPLKITDLPSNMLNGQFEGFVEGWTFRAGNNSLNLQINLSPAAYSVQSMRWNSVGATETWLTINPTLDWLNATIVS